jgi:hypothetical protein
MVFSGHASIEALPAQLKERVVEVVRGGGGPFAPAARLRLAQTPPLRTDRPRVRAHCWSFAFVKPTFRRGVARALDIGGFLAKDAFVMSHTPARAGLLANPQASALTAAPFVRKRRPKRSVSLKPSQWDRLDVLGDLTHWGRSGAMPRCRLEVRRGRLRISAKSITHFGPSRSLISVQSDHLFRSKAITHFAPCRSSDELGHGIG